MSIGLRNYYLARFQHPLKPCYVAIQLFRSHCRPNTWCDPRAQLHPWKGVGGTRASAHLYIYTPVISYIVLYTYDCIRIYTHIVHWHRHTHCFCDGRICHLGVMQRRMQRIIFNIQGKFAQFLYTWKGNEHNSTSFPTFPTSKVDLPRQLPTHCVYLQRYSAVASQGRVWPCARRRIPTYQVHESVIDPPNCIYIKWNIN